MNKNAKSELIEIITPEGERQIGYMKSDAFYGGLCRTYKRNSDKEYLAQEVYFIDGMRSGLLREWHENGFEKTSAFYYQDNKEGVSLEWDDSGQLVDLGVYKQSRLQPDESARLKMIVLIENANELRGITRQMVIKKMATFSIG